MNRTARGHDFARLAVALLEAWASSPVGTVTALDKKLKGRYVRFKVRDIHLPDPAVILRELHDDEELFGKIVDVSMSGSVGTAFAVVKVPKLRRPCIVLIERLEPRGKRDKVLP